MLSLRAYAERVEEKEGKNLYAVLFWKTEGEHQRGGKGDIWDTQWDMFIALLGAISAQLILSTIHDRELKGFWKTDTLISVAVMLPALVL